jgi:hypothetical protein
MNEDGASEGGSAPLHPSIARRVEEAAYLTAPNAERYRVIVHFFYRQYVEQRDWLTTEQVWRHVHEHFDSSYTVERCEDDLRKGARTQQQDAGVRVAADRGARE